MLLSCCCYCCFKRVCCPKFELFQLLKQNLLKIGGKRKNNPIISNDLPENDGGIVKTESRESNNSTGGEIHTFKIHAEDDEIIPINRVRTQKLPDSKTIPPILAITIDAPSKLGGLCDITDMPSAHLAGKFAATSVTTLLSLEKTGHKITSISPLTNATIDNVADTITTEEEVNNLLYLMENEDDDTEDV